MQNGAAVRGVTGLSSIHHQFNVQETKEYEAKKVPECTAVRVVQSERAWNSVAVDEVGGSGTSAEHS